MGFINLASDLRDLLIANSVALDNDEIIRREPRAERTLERLQVHAPRLASLHTPPLLERLAERAAVSKSTLTARFLTYVGMSPRRYLTRWRMVVAAAELNDGSLSLAEIAARVGYGSDVAFNRAFKAEFGVPPGEFRRDQAVSAAR